MNKIKIISDSTCDLTEKLVRLHDIEVIPLHVSFNDVEYIDGVNMTPELMYAKVDELGVLPKTSAVSPGEFEEVFSKYLSEGYQIIYIGIGSKFSATYQSARLAKSLIESDDIFLIDSMNLSSGTGLLVLKAARFKEQGDDPLTIKRKVEELVPKVRSQFVIDTLEYLYKGGRLNALSAFMGKVLNIHPVIEVNDCVMSVGKKAIGSMRKGINLMLKDAISKKDEIDTEFMMITHSLSNSFEYVDKKVKEHFDIKNVYETQTGCVISTHCGRGTMGILYILK